GRVSVAAVNSHRSTVIAGNPDAVAAIETDLTRSGVFVRPLAVNYASHTPHVEAIRELLVADSTPTRLSVTAPQWYSTVDAIPMTERLSADYWYRNLREPVRFADAIESMIDDGIRYFVELSPHPSLIMAVQTIAEVVGREVVTVGSLRRGEDGS